MNPAFTIQQRRSFIALAFAAAWLYTFSLLFQLFFTNTDNPEKVINRIEGCLHRSERDFNEVCADTLLVLQLFNRSSNADQLKSLQKDKDYTLLVYYESADSLYTLRFWNNRHALPNDEQLILPDGIYPLQRENGQFEYMRKTIVISDTRIVLVALVPLRWDYFIENEYLQKEFTASSRIEKRYTWSPEPTIYPIKNRDGQVMMYIKERTDDRNTGYSPFVIITRLLSIAMLLFLLFRYAAAWCQLKDFVTGFGILCGGLLVMRLALTYFDFPFKQSRLEFFDPVIYASGHLFPSLGSLVVDVMLFFMVLLFLLRRRKQASAEWSGILYKRPEVTGTVALVLYTLSTLFTGWLIRSIIADSTIPFDVTNFFNLSIYSLVGFIIVSVIVIAYFYLATALLHIANRFIIQPVFRYGIVALSGLVLLYLPLQFTNDPISIFILLWGLLLLAVFQYRAPQRFANIFSDNIIWLIFFSASVCMLFNHENSKKEMKEREMLAEKLALQSDPVSENLLSIALTRFDDLFLRKNFARFYNDSEVVSLKQQLVSNNFVGYLNKYETRIFTYDSLERPLFNVDTTPYQSFLTITRNQSDLVKRDTTTSQTTVNPGVTATPTPIAGQTTDHKQPVAAVETPEAPVQSSRVPYIADLYYTNKSHNDFEYIYLKKVEVDSGRRILGYFIVNARPLSFKNRSANLWPELFKNRKDFLYEKANNYIYAVYKNYEMRDQFIDYELPIKLEKKDIPVQTDTIKQGKNGTEELWHKINNNSVVVVGKKNNLVLATITLFAYLFFSFIFVWLLAAMLENLFSGRINLQTIREYMQFSIRKQVQGIIICASLLSFLVIGVAMIQLFRNRFNTSNRQRLAQTMAILRNDVKNLMSENRMFDDVVNIFETGSNRQQTVEDNINKMSEIHNVDFNVYDTTGKLTLSSLPIVTSRGVVSDRIDPVAYFHLNNPRGSSQVVQNEKIGSCPFLSMYVPVIGGGENRPAAYLNIPYYKSGTDLRQEISNFLLTIINLNAFIFLVAGLIAWLVTNRITRSFLLIGDKMKEVNLGKNEMISWHRNDEIGGLVNEYNKMVQKLEASAAVMAKSERESAWREMARQVAHEIKNPLTPMKLSIQYLQKSINSGSDNVQELTTSVTRTLVEQIDYLANIAADFSQFANILHAKTERFTMHELLRSLQLLFSSEEDVTIELDNNCPDVFVVADKTHINRLFTNLVQNALQAYPAGSDKRVHILVNPINDGHDVLVAVQDFGPGIPPEQQSKIFTPNFTTKTSGTGLGLAISKGIAEQAHGDIWFETELGKGTTFFVQLPIDP